MPDHNYFSSLIWQIADLLRGPYRPQQYERVMLPMTVLRRFDCVLAPTKARVFFDQIVEAATADDGLRLAAAVNPGDKYELVFRNLLQNLFMERMDQNDEI